MKKTLMIAALAATCMAAPAMADQHAADKAGHMMKADTDNDGFISKSEHDAYASMMFAKMDTDNDGKISKAEMSAKKEAWKGKHMKKGAKADHNDGSISDSADGEVGQNTSNHSGKANLDANNKENN